MTNGQAAETRRFSRFALAFLGALLAVSVAAADQDDPPTRAARLALAEGSVSFQPAGTSDWVAPDINRPVTIGDQLWSDNDSRAELQLDGSVLRVSADTSISFLNLNDSITQVRLSAGTLILRVRRLNDDETYEVDTPNLAFSVLRPGTYRVSVDASGNSTTIAVRSGQGEVTGAGVAYPVHAHESDVFSGTDQLAEDQAEAGEDAFDAWSANRDERWDRSTSARYVSPDVVGYADLDSYGSWRPTPDYGTVWFPRETQPGWAPYRNGHWAYIEPWGYTWVDDAPWGFAPFHYGRWAWVDGQWGWVPAPPAPPGGGYVPAVYAPALVAFVAVGAGVAWFALGPREVYVPSYPVSRAYVNNVNVSNTTVNTTTITNVYNTTIVNKTVNNITYVNRTVPGAVVATSPQAFTSAQPVARNIVHVDMRAVQSARVQAIAPAAVPTNRAVLGSARAAARTPPAAVQRRAVVARTAPPPPPAPVERRLAALQSNGGKPLSVAQIRQIGTAVARPAPVKVAPPARMVAPRTPVAASGGTPPANAAPNPAAVQPEARRPGASAEPPKPPPRPAEPAHPETARPAAPLRPNEPASPVTRAEPARPPTYVHPNEAPAIPRPPSPSIAQSALERQHLQEQQRLSGQQNGERQRLQQQQDAEHQRLADKARLQQVEAQHQAQTNQLAQRQAQAQRELEARQAEEKKRQSAPPPPRPRKDEHPQGHQP